MHRFIGNVGDDEEPAVNFLRQRKIIDKKNIKIIVAGDSIAGAAQTTAQYYFDNRMADGFSGMLKTSLEGYYGCKIDMSLFSEGGRRQIFSVEQSKRSY